MKKLPPYVLSIDIGSSSVRTLLFDRSATEVVDARSQRRYEFESTADGGSEVDANALLGFVASCLDETLARSGSAASPIVAVAMTTMVTTFLALDRSVGCRGEVDHLELGEPGAHDHLGERGIAAQTGPGQRDLAVGQVQGGVG